jgi:penicillin-binding protein 2
LSVDQKKYAFYALITIAFLGLTFQLAYLQIFERGKYLRHSQRNRIRRIIVQPKRGTIFDRNGVVLVENMPSYSVSAIPYESEKDDSLFFHIAGILSQDVREIQSKIQSARGPFTPVKLARDVEFSTLIRIEERKLDFPGILFDIEPKRHYPGGVRAPHLFGYIGEISQAELKERGNEGLQKGDIIGKKGIEKIYDRTLRGKPGYAYHEVDALGRVVRDLDIGGKSPPVSGNDLYLTLDAKLQKLAEELFDQKNGGVILLDVRNGGVLVDCSKPDYDPFIFSGLLEMDAWRDLINDPDKPLYDRMIQSTFPPGSTFKLILATAALQKNAVNLSEKTVCNGYVRLGNRTFNCWKKDGHGAVDFMEAIKRSCNVYFFRLMPRVDLDDWAAFARDFGFGKVTGIDLANESSGNQPDREYLDQIYGKNGWSKGTLYNMAIGQGDVLVTPLQMAQLAMIIANKGHYYQPHVLDRTYDVETKEMIPFHPVGKSTKLVSEEVYDVIRKAMLSVVNEEGGTGRASWIRDVLVAGKTGTAQNPHGESHAWFIGFAPFDNPQVAICVFVENGGGGGAVAAPLAGEMLKAYFQQKDTLTAAL